MRSAYILAVFLSLPLLAAGHDITPPTYAPSAYSSTLPVVATNGDTFLTLWTQFASDAGPYVLGSLADASGNVITPVAFVVAPQTKVVQVFADGKNYVALLVDTKSSLHVARIDSSGRLISLTAAGSALIQNYPQVAFDGSHFFMLDIDYARGQIVARLIDLNGNATEQPLWPYEGLYDVVATADGFVAFAADRDGVFLQRFGRNGAALTSKLRVAADSGPGFLTIASNGNNFGVAWAQLTPPFCTCVPAITITAAALRADGTIIGRSQIPSSQVSNLSMSWNGSTYVLVGQATAGAFASRVDERGAFLDTPAPIGTGIAAASSRNVTYSIGPGSTTPSVVGAAVVTDSSGIHAKDAQLLSNTLKRQSIDAIATDGVDFLTTWTNQTQNATQHSAARLSPDATPIDAAEIAIDPGPSTPYARSSVAFGRSMYLVAWQTASKVLARRVLPNGVFVDAQPIEVGSGALPEHAIAWNGSRFLIVWLSGSNATASFLGETGTLSDPIQIPAAGSVTWNGQHFLVATMTYSGYVIIEPSAPNAIRVDQLTTAGTVVDSLIISASPRRLHLASGPRDSMLVVDQYVDAPSVAAYTIHTGDMLTVDAPVAVFSTYGDYASDVTWNGASYTVTWHSGYGDAWWLSTARVSGTAVMNPVTTPTARPDTAISPAIAVNAASQAVITVSELQPSSGVIRARAYAERELQPMPPVPAAPRITSAVTSGLKTTIEWESNATAVAGFELESVNAYGPSFFARAEGNSRSITVPFRVDAVRIRAFGPAGVSQPSATVTVTTPARRRATGR
jgi:hypothetical protein